MAEPAGTSRTQPTMLDCLQCPTRSSAEWSVLSDAEMAGINETKTSRRYQRGEYVFTQGQPCTGLYCIASGTAAMRRMEPELPAVLVRLAFAGETLGYRSVMEGVSCSGGAKVLEPCVICHIESGMLHRLLRRHRPLAARFQAHLAADLDAAEQGLAQVAWLPVRNRVARLLVTLADRDGGGRRLGATEVSVPMARRDMAELLCTRPETLTRALNALESDGVLRSDGHRIGVPDIARLREEARPPPAGADSSRTSGGDSLDAMRATAT